MQRIEWKKKDSRNVMETVERCGVPYLSFPVLEETGLVTHGFSTRLGGASEGVYASMNFSFTRGDEPEHVRENYRRMAKALGVEAESMVLTYQTHTVNIRRTGKEDRGKGVFRERDYRDIDGLVTDEPGVTLVTFFADCVPLYFLDPVRHAIGLSHSGWRGTVGKIGKITVERMGEEFGSKPEDIIACIGPSICKDCFEVGEEVVELFAKAFPPKIHDRLFSPNGKPGKYQLDLWEANREILLEAGIRPERLQVTNLCTCCNPDYLYSHRKMGEKRGNLCAFLTLKEE